VHNVKFIVRRLSGSSMMGGYVRELELPFVPTVGMQFKQGGSTWMWETALGELAPPIETVVYDLDEGMIVCLFTVDQELSSAFWTTLDYEGLGERCAELDYFRNRG
jgi:hypothetical protein